MSAECIVVHKTQFYSENSVLHLKLSSVELAPYCEIKLRELNFMHEIKVRMQSAELYIKLSSILQAQFYKTTIQIHL